MKFIKKRRDEYSYDDDASFYDEEYYGAPTAKEGNGFDDDEPAPEVKSTSGVSFAGSGSPVALKVVKPKGFEDAPEIADYLAEGSTVLLNIETLDTASTKRLLDFLLGATHVLGGTMNMVAKGTFVFAPKSVGVSEVVSGEEAEEPAAGEEEIEEIPTLD